MNVPGRSLPGGGERCLICQGPTPPLVNPRGRRVCFESACTQAFATMFRDIALPCAICGSALTAQQKAEGIVCSQKSCVGSISPKLHRAVTFCAGCNRELRPGRQRHEMTCDSVDCRRLGYQLERARFQLVANKNHLDEEERLRQEEFERLKRLEAKLLSEYEVAEFEGVDKPTIAFVPYNKRLLADLPAERIELLRGHLESLLAQVEPRDPSTAPRPVIEARSISQKIALDEASLMSTACGACGGFCCQGGSHYAHISVKTLRGYVEKFPETPRAEVVANYLSHVPKRTYLDSCVFHGERGCGLPREMRSDVCNSHYCEKLISIRRTVENSDPRFVVFAAVTGEGEVMRTAPVVRGREGEE